MAHAGFAITTLQTPGYQPSVGAGVATVTGAGDGASVGAGVGAMVGAGVPPPPAASVFGANGKRRMVSNNRRSSRRRILSSRRWQSKEDVPFGYCGLYRRCILLTAQRCRVDAVEATFTPACLDRVFVAHAVTSPAVFVTARFAHI